MNAVAVTAHFYPLSGFFFFCISIMRKPVCYFIMKKGIPSPSVLRFRQMRECRWGGERERERQYQTLRKFRRGGHNGLHRERSSSGDRLGKCLIVLDCRGGREDVAIHLHLSPPFLSSTPQPSLLSSVSPHPIQLSPTFSSYLHLSKSITIISLSVFLSVFISFFLSLSHLLIYCTATERWSEVSLSICMPG